MSTSYFRYDLYVCNKHAVYAENLPNSASWHQCWSVKNTLINILLFVLFNIKIYRHAAFAVLSFVVLLGVISVFEDTLSFRIVFAAIHLLSCLALSAQVYYMGRWKLGTICIFLLSVSLLGTIYVRFLMLCSSIV